MSDVTENGTPVCNHKICCCDDTTDFITVIAGISMVLGLILMTIGYVVPREYEFNPHAPARDMEAIEIHYAYLQHYLNICIITGMGFVAAGGLIVTGLIIHGICCGQFWDRSAIGMDWNPNVDDRSGLIMERNTNYGTDRQSHGSYPLHGGHYEMNKR